jgi:hypothetical protein
VLDWLMTLAIDARAWLEPELPAMFRELERSYGLESAVVARDDGEATDEERAWGFAPPREYAEILARTYEREWHPRFSARGINAVISPGHEERPVFRGRPRHRVQQLDAPG